VHLCTVHTSKGLEYPVVFIAGCGERFQFLENRKKLLMHRKYGLASDFYDFESRVKEPSFIRNALKTVCSYECVKEEINILYDNNRCISVCLLLRKLFENLIIDILRKRYGAKQINLFYNPSKGMFQSFSVLLDNLNTKIDDFKYIDPNFNEEMIKKIDFYREKGNSSAHSISADITKKEIDDRKDDINYLVMFWRLTNEK
jgi:hypothetical protein